MNMDDIKVYFKKLDPLAKIPVRAHIGADAGMDLCCMYGFTIQPGEDMMVSTGIATAIPKNTVMIVKDKSGIATKRKITTDAGVVDHGYSGELKVHIRNNGTEAQHFSHGDPVAQLLIVPCWLGEPVEVDSLPDSDRGTNGFGSDATNRKV